eukprot:GHVU01138013.1.p1 GENE.GHVU01138013.1~~GHVU01138013.1.p1  ORF type:complete len:178 (-),score=14.80 GHVU01138013.1:1798-2331(-)
MPPTIIRPVNPMHLLNSTEGWLKSQSFEGLRWQRCFLRFDGTTMEGFSQNDETKLLSISMKQLRQPHGNGNASPFPRPKVSFVPLDKSNEDATGASPRYAIEIVCSPQWAPVGERFVMRVDANAVGVTIALSTHTVATSWLETLKRTLLSHGSKETSASKQDALRRKIQRTTDAISK